MRRQRMNLNDVMAPELLAGEEILWAGQSDQTKLLAKEDIILVPFSVFWCSMSVMWMVMAFAESKLTSLAGLPFLAVGVYLTVGRFYVKNEQKKRTFFAVTDRRVLVLQVKKDGEKKRLTALELNRITQETSKIDSKGRGTIVFGRIPASRRFWFNIGFPRGWMALPAFLDIEECRQVLRIYQNGKGKLKGSIQIPGYK